MPRPTNSSTGNSTANIGFEAKQPTIGKIVDDAMVAIERDNPRLKGVLPKDYARPGLDKQRLGELIDVIATIALTTDYLKMNPWWSEEAERVADEIRGKMKQATLFLVPEEKLSTIRRGITNWLFPGREWAPDPKTA